MKYTEMEVQNAKDMSLVNYISSNEGLTIQKVGNFYTSKEHDSLRILNYEETFFWSSRGINVHNVIDWLMKTRNIIFIQALEELLGRKTETEVKKPVIKEEVKKIQLPYRADNNTVVYDYLTKIRCLDDKIVQQIFKDNLAYQDIYRNVVFLRYDEKNAVKFAEPYDQKSRRYKERN